MSLLTARAFAFCVATTPLLFGCRPTITPVDPPPDRHADPSPTPSSPSPTAEPFVVFKRVDEVLAPLACWDGQAFLSTDASECMDLVPDGAAVGLSDGGSVALDPVIDAPCGRGENTFTARAPRGPVPSEVTHAIWPASLAGALERVDANLEPTGAEVQAIAKAFASEVEGVYEVEPKLRITSGLEVDLDGDAKLDRVFTTFEDGRLYGGVFVFMATKPELAVSLSVLQFDYIEVFGITELDGRPGRELWIDAAFIEGLEGGNVTSAISERIVALGPEGLVEIGSWGCRMF